MDIDLTSAVAYSIYLVWLACGRLDFALHQRTSISTTSGVAESVLHGVQIGIIGAGAVAWLAMLPSWANGLLLVFLGTAHAVAGYLDTKSADQVRRISPLEQHVHSVLDIAPWVFIGWALASATPGWLFSWDPRETYVWGAVLLPALPMVIVPWLREIRGAIAARRRSRQLSP